MRERQIANETIQQIAASSEGFAKSIMGKIEEALVSGKYSAETCLNFIKAIACVPSESTCATLFITTIQKVVEKI